MFTNMFLMIDSYLQMNIKNIIKNTTFIEYFDVMKCTNNIYSNEKHWE